MLGSLCSKRLPNIYVIELICRLLAISMNLKQIDNIEDPYQLVSVKPVYVDLHSFPNIS